MGRDLRIASGFIARSPRADAPEVLLHLPTVRVPGGLSLNRRHQIILCCNCINFCVGVLVELKPEFKKKKSSTLTGSICQRCFSWLAMS